MTPHPVLPLDATAIESYHHDGYSIHCGLFDRRTAEEVAAWLKAQEQAKLDKSWTEQKPGVPLTVWG